MTQEQNAALEILLKELSDEISRAEKSREDLRIAITYATITRWLDLCTLAGSRPIERSEHLAVPPQIDEATVPPVVVGGATVKELATALLGLMDAEGDDTDQWLDVVMPEMLRDLCGAVITMGTALQKIRYEKLGPEDGNPRAMLAEIMNIAESALRSAPQRKGK